MTKKNTILLLIILLLIVISLSVLSLFSVLNQEVTDPPVFRTSVMKGAIRSGPARSYPLIALTEKDKEYKLLGFNKNKSWAKILHEGQEAWVSRVLGTPIRQEDIDCRHPIFIARKSSGIYHRPTYRSSNLSWVRQDDTLKIINKMSTWYLVETKDNILGWIHWKSGDIIGEYKLNPISVAQVKSDTYLYKDHSLKSKKIILCYKNEPVQILETYIDKYYKNNQLFRKIWHRAALADGTEGWIPNTKIEKSMFLASDDIIRNEDMVLSLPKLPKRNWIFTPYMIELYIVIISIIISSILLIIFLKGAPTWFTGIVFSITILWFACFSLSMLNMNVIMFLFDEKFAFFALLSILAIFINSSIFLPVAWIRAGIIRKKIKKKGKYSKKDNKNAYLKAAFYILFFLVLLFSIEKYYKLNIPFYMIYLFIMSIVPVALIGFFESLTLTDIMFKHTISNILLWIYNSKKHFFKTILISSYQIPIIIIATLSLLLFTVEALNITMGIMKIEFEDVNGFLQETFPINAYVFVILAWSIRNLFVTLFVIFKELFQEYILDATTGIRKNVKNKIMRNLSLTHRIHFIIWLIGGLSFFTIYDIGDTFDDVSAVVLLPKHFKLLKLSDTILFPINDLVSFIKYFWAIPFFIGFPFGVVKSIKGILESEQWKQYGVFSKKSKKPH